MPQLRTANVAATTTIVTSRFMYLCSCCETSSRTSTGRHHQCGGAEGWKRMPFNRCRTERVLDPALPPSLANAVRWQTLDHHEPDGIKAVAS
jgi:hypothetical protein